jgi:tRNA threonylcarbamoyladenosine biosynthesis protein TsaB
MFYYRSMLVLALDTATRAGSCALARDGVLLRELASDPSAPPASRLPGELMALLESEHVGPRDVDVFAVATGPGSFTGLRVGIATMQGLAFAEGKPLVGVSGFDALAVLGAAPPHAPARVATWVDAWRGDVYAALYEGEAEIEPPVVAHPDDLLPRLRGRATVFIGDGAGSFRSAIQQALGASAIVADPASPLLAGIIAQLAGTRASAGELPPPDAIRPLYVRRPDAELARDRDVRVSR